MGISDTRFAYDGSDLIAEYDGANSLLRRYVHGPGTDEPIVRYEGSSLTSKSYMLADERGSITSISNAAGTATALLSSSLVNACARVSSGSKTTTCMPSSANRRAVEVTCASADQC